MPRRHDLRADLSALNAFGHQERPPGLFLQVVDWMMAPMVVLWPACVLGAYFAASAIAEEAFDRELREMVRTVAHEAQAMVLPGATAAAMPATNAFRNERIDRLFANVSWGGVLVAGDAAIPPLRVPLEVPLGVVHFRDAHVDEEPVRIAAERLDAGGRPLLVQVAEPVARRRALVSSLTSVVMVVVGILVPATVFLAWLGLKRGLAPLVRLQERIAARSPDDLSPIPPEEVPAEVAPLTAALNAQLQRVRSNLDAQRRFVADAAHQLRTPLAGLKTQAEAAARGATLAEASARIQQVSASADRLSRLIAQLLALARADDAFGAPQAMERVNLAAILRDVCGDAAPAAVAKHIAFAFEASAQDVPVQGAPLLLRELFANLVDNAIRYTPAGGEVVARVRQGVDAEVHVEDTGIGIAPAERERVFERFHRVLGTGESGSGLGLSIVKAIAQLHHAQLEVAAGASARGTRFVIRFPRLGENPDPRRPPVSSP